MAKSQPISSKIIACSMDSSGVLTPSEINPVVNVQLHIGSNEEGLAGKLLIGERVIAFLQLDLFDKIIIGYTCTDLSETAHITETSIKNILSTLQ